MTTKQSKASKRLVKNSLILYMRTFVTMLIGLYSSRLILLALGVEDFGIYRLVAGFVSMFAIVSASLTAASQRYITFELGKPKDQQRLKEVFSTTVIIHIGIALLVFVLGQSLGVWFLNTYLNIDSDRMLAANWVFHCSLIAFMLNIVRVPYNALIIANEKMTAFAVINIADSILRLFIVFALDWILFDSLITYAVLVLLVGVIIWFSYYLYSKLNFKNFAFVFIIDKVLIKKISSFAGWNFIGAGSGILRVQGVNILINIFYGVTVNAAKGIANQVEHAMVTFTDSFMTAMRPQITKSYASGDYNYFMTLIYKGARLSFYLTLLFALPVFLETDYILKLWLKIVPDFTVIFVKLSLIYVLFESFSRTLITAMLATGRIRNYQIIVGGLQLLNLPISYLLLAQGNQPQVVIVVAIVISFCMLVARLLLLRNMINVSIQYFFNKVLINSLIVLLLSALVPYFVFINMDEGFVRLILVGLTSVISVALFVYFIGSSAGEKALVKQVIIKYKNKLEK